MKQYFNFFHLILLIPVLVLYTNCDGYKSSDETLGSLGSCANSASLSLKLLKFDPETDCLDKDLISCDVRSFSPENSNQSNNEERCLNHPTYGEVCINLTIRNYNTTGASRDPAEYAPGAAYNYDEVNCHLQKFSHQDVAIFSSSEDNLENSLSALYERCTKGARQ